MLSSSDMNPPCPAPLARAARNVSRKPAKPQGGEPLLYAEVGSQPLDSEWLSAEASAFVNSPVCGGLLMFSPFSRCFCWLDDAGAMFQPQPGTSHHCDLCGVFIGDLSSGLLYLLTTVAVCYNPPRMSPGCS